MNCELCKREATTTEHHLVPREKKKKSEEFGATADLCKDCHRMIHATYDNKKLAKELNTLESLRSAQELQGYFKWIKKQPGCTYFGSRDRKS